MVALFAASPRHQYVCVFAFPYLLMRWIPPYATFVYAVQCSLCVVARLENGLFIGPIGLWVSLYVYARYVAIPILERVHFSV